jgi:hypothetical protein
MTLLEPPPLYDQEADDELELEPEPPRQHSKPIGAAEVQKLWREADQFLLRERLNFDLNLSFFLGEQWVMPTNRTLQEIEWQNTREKNSRTTVDKFGPRTRTLLARLMPEDLAFESRASGISDASLRAKQLREQLLESERTQHNWEDVRVDNLLNVLFGGVAAIEWEWDPDGYDENDEPDPDETSVDYLSGFSYPTGCVRPRALNIKQFALQPGIDNWRDAKWWIRASLAPPELVQERYDLKKPPSADAQASIGAKHRTLLREHTGKDEVSKATQVLVYYERPTRNEPGQIAHVVDGEVVEHDLTWTFPFRDLNLDVFRAERIQGRWTGGTLLNTARPIQMTINHIASTILEHARKAANARMWYPEGSIVDEDSVTNEVAELVAYDPGPSGAKPEWERPPEVARWLMNSLETAKADLDDVFHTADIDRGVLADRTSGLAASIAAEKSDTPLTFIARDQARGWGRGAERALMMLAAKKQGGSVNVTGPDGSSFPVEWSTEDVGTNPRVTVPIKSTMPRTKFATQALVKDFLAANPMLAESLDMPALLKLLGATEADQFIHASDRDHALAQWENQLLAQGVAVVPALYNDHVKHIATHMSEQNTPEYQYREPQYQQMMEAHIAAHETLEQQKQMAMQPPPGIDPAMMEGLPEGLAPPPGLPAGAPPPAEMAPGAGP